MKRDMADSFRYDLWATKQWISALLAFPEPKEPNEVLTHVLFAQWRWLNRLNGSLSLGLALPVEPKAPSTTLAEELTGLWLPLLDQIAPDTVLRYTMADGQDMESTFGDIAAHVPNHGTYHRGQLRGLAQAQLVKDFPETDFILWARLGKPV